MTRGDVAARSTTLTAYGQVNPHRHERYSHNAEEISGESVDGNTYPRIVKQRAKSVDQYTDWSDKLHSCACSSAGSKRTV